MNHRSLALLTLTACVGLAAGVLMFSQDSLATSSLDDLEYLQSAPAEPVADMEELAPAPAEGSFRKSDGPAVAASAPVREDTSGWTSGVIRGDVQLAVSVLDRLGSMTVIVEELKANFSGQAPRRIMQAVERGRGTPTFEVRDVPFSEYPYRVTLHVAGLNSSGRDRDPDNPNPMQDRRW